MSWELFKRKEKQKPSTKKLAFGKRGGRYITTAHQSCPECGSTKNRERGKGDNIYYKCLKCGTKFR